METVMTVVNDGIRVTDDDEKLTACIASLTRNNTFFPNIVSVKEEDVMVATKDKETKEKIKDKDGKVVRERRRQMTVRFADGTWVQLRRNPDDADDPIVAVLYAIAKRLFGEPNGSGFVNGNQFMNKLRKITDKIQTPEKEAKDKEAKAKAIADAQAKAHAEAEKRKEEHPSLRQCVNKLDDLLQKLLQKLDK